MADSRQQQTLVRKITIGTPISKVVGAAAQQISDLTDVTFSNIQDDDIIQYDASTGKWRNVALITGGTF
tara:strand:+ start:1625 stop:1831 length:207 start_codon:yes stop_codon:yes gene_type:complete